MRRMLAVLVVAAVAMPMLARGEDETQSTCTSDIRVSGIDLGVLCVNMTLSHGGDQLDVTLNRNGDETIVSEEIALDTVSPGRDYCQDVSICDVCVRFDDIERETTHVRACPEVVADCGFETFSSRLPCSVFGTDPADLPELPLDFEATVEANIAEKNYTLTVREYYDSEFDRVRLERHNGVHEPYQSLVIELGPEYGDRLYAIADGSCEVRNITESRMARHLLDPATGELRSARDMFEDFRGSNFSYLGQAPKPWPRGIACDHWISHQEHNFTSHHGHGDLGIDLTVTWYFAVKDWEWLHSATHRLPVRASLKGSFHNFTAGTTHDISHVYDWVSFVVGQPDPALFAVPEGVVCEDISNPPVPSMDTEFSQHVEITIPHRKESHHAREFFSYEHNAFRRDHIRRHSEAQEYEIVRGDVGKEFRVTTDATGTPTECRVADVDRSRVWDPATHHLRRLSPTIPVDPNTNEPDPMHYAGESVTEGGVPANSWTTGWLNRTFTGRDNHTVHARVLYQAWYAVDTWNVIGLGGSAAASAKPEGAAYSGTATVGNVTFDFHNEITFSDTVYGEIDDSIFVVPTLCEGAPPATVTTKYESVVSKDGAVTAGVAVALGAVGFALAMFCRLKRLN